MPAISRMGSLLVLPLLVLGLMLAGAVASPDADAATGAKIRRAVDVALNQKGDPYRYGAAGPNAFDCSGLVYFSFRRAGFDRIPRTSGGQSGLGRKVRKSNMRRGDLMFFYSGSGVYHAAIFLRWKDGHAVMWDSPRSGERVGRSVPWTKSWFGRTLRR